ncbi:MAG: MazG nucleotide pyrophosphohydrolase domain-containing protein [Promethearchaeota archaeon]
MNVKEKDKEAKIDRKRKKFLDLMNKNVDMKEAQKIVDEWVEENGGYWEPFAMLAAVLEELGELSKEISHIEKIKIKKADKSSTNLELELGDLIFSIICVANHYKIDIMEALKKSIVKFTSRDWKRFK